MVEKLDCQKYGCKDPYLSEEQRRDAHKKHVVYLAKVESDGELPVVPDVAFCDRSGFDRTHHARNDCMVVRQNIVEHGCDYIPRENRRVILGLYRESCLECVSA
jgi:hypothetical protein